MRSFVLLLCIGLGSTGMVVTAHAAGDPSPAPTRLAGITDDTGAGNGFRAFSRGDTASADTVAAKAAGPATPHLSGNGPDGHDAELSVRAIQRLLNRLGFEAGTPDGISGAKTRAAIMAYQESRGLEPTGNTDAAFNARLREDILRGPVDRVSEAVTTAATDRPADLPSSNVAELPAAQAVTATGPAGNEEAAPKQLSAPVCIVPATAMVHAPASPPAVPDDGLQRAVWEFFTISRDIVLFLIRAVDDDPAEDVAITAAANTTVVASIQSPGAR